MTNFHLYLIKLWWQFFQTFVYGEVVMLRIGSYWPWKTVSIEPPSYASTAYVATSYGPRFFSTVRFVNLWEFFWANQFTAPPGKKFPLRLWFERLSKYIELKIEKARLSKVDFKKGWKSTLTKFRAQPASTSFTKLLRLLGTARILTKVPSVKWTLWYPRSTFWTRCFSDFAQYSFNLKTFECRGVYKACSCRSFIRIHETS